MVGGMNAVQCSACYYYNRLTSPLLLSVADLVEVSTCLLSRLHDKQAPSLSLSLLDSYRRMRVRKRQRSER